LTKEKKWETVGEVEGCGEALKTFLTERKDSSKCIVEHGISDYFPQKGMELLSKKNTQRNEEKEQKSKETKNNIRHNE
jgi:hypothetical protein